MPADPNPIPPRPADRVAADDARFAELSAALAAAVDAVVAGWIEALVVERIRAWAGHVSPEIAAAAVTAGETARREVAERLGDLLATDVDEQRVNPLAILRDATRHADAVLAEAGMPTGGRDAFAASAFPDDRYGLVPATWSDVDPSLHEPGLAWGAAKAYVFKARRRDEGKT